MLFTKIGRATAPPPGIDLLVSKLLLLRKVLRVKGVVLEGDKWATFDIRTPMLVRYGTT
jgi:hypothetical protein